MLRLVLTFTILISSISCIHAELIGALKHGKWGYIESNTGKFVIQAKFDEARVFHEGLAVVRVGNLFGVIDKKGSYTVKPKYDNADYNFSDGYLGVYIDGAWGFVDNKGTTSIKPQFDNIAYFNEGKCVVYKNKKLSVIDKSGNLLFNYKKWNNKGLRSPIVFRDDRAVVFSTDIEELKTLNISLTTLNTRNGKIKGSYIIINSKGKIYHQLANGSSVNINNAVKKRQIEPTFRAGLMAYINPDNSFSYVNTDMEEVFRLNGDITKVYGFFNGVAGVVSNDKLGLIDKSGNYLAPASLPIASSSPIPIYENGVILVKNSNHKFGYIDKSGKQLVENFDKLSPMHNGIASAKKNGKYGIINQRGTWIIPPSFDKLLYPEICTCFN